jgi:N-acyl homoserine lactone hydrolase
MSANPIQMFILDGGRVVTEGVRFLGPNGIEEKRDMADPNHCYLIRHPQGLFMWDTGLSDSIYNLPEHTLVSGRFRFVVENPLRAQLAQIGIQPEDVSCLAFSHLQIDHAGNTSMFPNAEILIQAKEYEIAFGSEAEDWGYRRVDYETLANRKIVHITGDRDVFGDGSVMILSAPGHTPGHQILLVNLPQSGPVMLSGDLYYAPKDPIEGWMPAWNYDQDQTHQTMEHLQSIAKEKNARWIINHDPSGSHASGWLK